MTFSQKQSGQTERADIYMTVMQKQSGETDGADIYDSQPETERTDRQSRHTERTGRD